MNLKPKTVFAQSPRCYFTFNQISPLYFPKLNYHTSLQNLKLSVCAVARTSQFRASATLFSQILGSASSGIIFIPRFVSISAGLEVERTHIYTV